MLNIVRHYPIRDWCATQHWHPPDVTHGARLTITHVIEVLTKVASHAPTATRVKPAVIMLEDTLFHYLVGYYTTHHLDGMHLSARCTCEEKLEGIVKNKCAAMIIHFDVENHIHRFSI